MKVSNSAERLQELMRTLGIKQIDIANRTGIHKSVISLYVNGDRLPRQDKIAVICDAYNIDPAWLMGYEVPMQKQRIDTRDKEISDINKVIAGSSDTRDTFTKYIKLDRPSREAVANLIDLLSSRNTPTE